MARDWKRTRITGKEWLYSNTVTLWPGRCRKGDRDTTAGEGGHRNLGPEYSLWRIRKMVQGEKRIRVKDWSPAGG